KLKKGIIEVASTQTLADGSYSFTGIVPGSYTVEEVVQDGWTQSYPVSPGMHPVTLVSGVAGLTNLDFGNFRAVSFSGVKFEDSNGNGARDSGEPGLEGWTIKLMKEGNEIASTETAADGTYSFADVAPGSYTVEETDQTGWIQTSPAGDVYSAVSNSGQVKITRADQSIVPSTEVNFGNRKLVEAFQVSITANQQTVLPGQTLVFYININRDSNIDLKSLTVEYTLPKGLNFVDSNHSPLSVTQNADGTTTITWTFTAFSSQMAAQAASSQSISASPTDALASSTTITVTTEVQPDAPQSLTGTVVVTGSSSEAAIAEAKDTVSVNVEKMPDQPILLNKTSDLKEVWPGATIGYTITYESLLKKAYLNDVVITEQASSDLIFLSASPAPDQGTDNVWSIGQLDPGEMGTINVFFQVKNTTNLSFYSQSSVSGSGFVSSYRRLSTETQSGGLKNSVTLTCNEFTPVSTSYFVKLRDSEGTSLLKKEHGSGEYRSEEEAALQMQNRSIKSISSLLAFYRPTSFSLLRDQALHYDSEISSLTQTRNHATQASTSQEFRYAKSLEMEQQLLLDKNETTMYIEAKMQGQAHLGVLKKDGEAVKPSPIFESSQDYAGDFRLNGSLQDYGSNVLQAGNASGIGQAASDQRLKKSQRSYEHGNGSYQSEELVSTAESYITRELSVSSYPKYGYGKWKAGIWSQSPGQSYLGQEIGGADYIREETKASGLNDMSSNLSYNGQGRFRAVSEPDNWSMVDLDEEYVGEYSLQRKVHLGGVSRFDRPHITLIKEGRPVDRTTMVDYRITVLNDGNAALGPVYVWDPFPAGTDYLSASIKPTVLKSDSINWTLLYLGIGQTVKIDLRLNITDPRDALVNRVYATGGHNDEWVFTSNMSAMRVGWLACCSNALQAEMQAQIDSSDSRMIRYRVYLQNPSNVSIAARVANTLPLGLKFVDASQQPQNDGRTLSWVTEAILPGESRYIEYRVRTLQDGKYANAAAVESHPLDGSEGGESFISATVVIGNETSYAEGGWKPPEWGLDRSDVFDTIIDTVAGEDSGDTSCESGS
ncbi:MAG: SdrD B-like domain-containing protein, partial [Methanothrix sp.]